MSIVERETPAAACEAIPEGVCIHCRLPIPQSFREAKQQAQRSAQRSRPSHSSQTFEATPSAKSQEAEHPQTQALAGTPALQSDWPAPVLFCCHGCEAAYELLHASGLDDFYQYRAQEPTAAGRPVDSGESYEEFDDPAFHAAHVETLDGAMRRIALRLDGIHCRACVWLLERLPRLAPGVSESRLNLHRGTLTVTWNNELSSLSMIANRLDRLGYRPYPFERHAAEDADRAESRRRLTEIAIAAAVSGNLMLIAIALYAGWWSGMDAGLETYLRWVSAGLGAIALLGPGRSFFIQAWAGLRAGVPNMDLPIALGLGLGTTVGWINTFRDEGEIYFDSLGMLVFLLLVGRWIQYRQTRRASEDIRRLYELTPSRARKLIESGEARWVPASALAVGDRVRVLGNETIPADGIIVRGNSSIDRSLLTGESQPVEVTLGDAVHGGMNNIESPIEVEVTAIGSFSRLGRLIDLVETAALKRTRWVQRADSLGGWFVVVIVVATLGTAIGWSWAGDEKAWDHAIALAIVACPCALGLATPLAIAVSVGRAARERLLVKGGDALERLVKPGMIWFDKTGTLTEGKPSLRSWVGDRSVIDAVIALEAHSNHGAARAITRDAPKYRLNRALPQSNATDSPPLAPEKWSVDQVQQGETGGIAGEVNGVAIRIGTLKYLAQAMTVEPKWERWSQWVSGLGCTPILVGRQGVVVAGLSVGDAVRGEAKQIVARLQKLGWSTGILSGDHPNVVRGVAQQLGIPREQALGGLSPEEKVAQVNQSRQGHGASCVMVGDGMNDSAALAAADVGVSVQSGAEISLRSADVYLGRSGFAPLLPLLHGARQTMATIQLGLGISLMYNGLAVVLAAAGKINPLLAAALMPVSSLTVVAIALGGSAFRSRRKESLAPQTTSST